MARPRNKFLDYLVYLALRLFTMFVHMFSTRANYRTARMIGDALYRFDRRHRERTQGHLRESFPDWSPERIDRVARQAMRNLVYLGLEVMLTPRLIAPPTWRRYVTLRDISETLRLVLERRSAVILVTGHLGNFEVVGYTLATLGFGGYAVARPLDNPYVNEYVKAIRQRNGLVILDKRGATEQLDRILAGKGHVGFIADQDAGRTGLFVDFFGRKAATYKAIALMALEHDVPVVVGCGKRLKEQYGFEIAAHRIIYPAEWRDKPDPMRWITQEYTTALEEIIRQAPEQYLWVHRRWKHRPRGEERGPDGIA
jgi:KDO2-lipid IV(A) lauroyltransferase